MLTLIALAALSPAAPVTNLGSGVHAEARATATIQRGVTLQNGTAATRTTDIAPVAGAPRDCSPPDKPAPDCRLIVYDLP